MYPEIDLKIESEVIVAQPRKLKAVWSYEAAEDMKQWHNIDAETALTNALAQEINAEIDREILADLGIAASKAKKEADEKAAKKKYGKHLRPRSITDDWEVSADA
jgi:hypothetical protein